MCYERRPRCTCAPKNKNDGRDDESQGFLCEALRGCNTASRAQSHVCLSDLALPSLFLLSLSRSITSPPSWALPSAAALPPKPCPARHVLSTPVMSEKVLCGA